MTQQTCKARFVDNGNSQDLIREQIQAGIEISNNNGIGVNEIFVRKLYIMLMGLSSLRLMKQI